MYQEADGLGLGLGLCCRTSLVKVKLISWDINTVELSCAFLSLSSLHREYDSKVLTVKSEKQARKTVDNVSGEDGEWGINKRHTKSSHHNTIIV
jgi:hypothetical protein